MGIENTRIYTNWCSRFMNKTGKRRCSWWFALYMGALIKRKSSVLIAACECLPIRKDDALFVSRAHGVTKRFDRGLFDRFARYGLV